MAALTCAPAFSNAMSKLYSDQVYNSPLSTTTLIQIGVCSCFCNLLLKHTAITITLRIVFQSQRENSVMFIEFLYRQDVIYLLIFPLVLL